MKTFLSTTALALTLATSSIAGGHMAAYVDQPEATDIRGSEFIGSYIYTAEFEPGEVETMSVRDERLMVADAERDWDNIGEVNDVLLSRDGALRAVLLDIGGFLGMGEKTVAVSMDSLRFVQDGDNPDDYFLVVNSTKDALMEAPEFDFSMLEREMEETAAETGQAMAEAGAEIEAETEEMAAEIETETEEMTAEVESEANELSAETEAEMAEMDRARRDALANLEVDGFERVAIDELTTEDLTGTTVYGINDENVGEISELVVSTDGQIEKAVIDVGGFLGIGEKPVAVGFDQLSIQRNAQDGFLRVYIDATEESLEQQPEYEN